MRLTIRRKPINRNVVALIVLALSGSFSASTLANQESDVTPRIVFDVTGHDFGDHVAGSILNHTFNFRNTGTAPLFIESVKAG